MEIPHPPTDRAWGRYVHSHNPIPRRGFPSGPCKPDTVSTGDAPLPAIIHNLIHTLANTAALSPISLLRIPMGEEAVG